MKYLPIAHRVSYYASFFTRFALLIPMLIPECNQHSNGVENSRGDTNSVLSKSNKALDRGRNIKWRIVWSL